MKKTISICVAVILLVSAFSAIACGDDKNSNNSSPTYAGPVTIMDRTVTIQSGNTFIQDLTAGSYDVSISSDDPVDVQWIGGGVDSGYNTTGGVKEYTKRMVPVFEAVTFKIHNPSGVFSNPTAVLHVKIVKQQ